jgi:error-prone DNA polymerase
MLGFMKVDVLALGMLSCMRRAFDLHGPGQGRRLDLATIPAEDPATYAMIRKADTLGVFQIESRAQMAMLPLIKPTTFYDLVIQVAIVRPGPIQGDMVHPYLRRRERQGAGDLSQPPSSPRAREDARRAAVPGTGDARRDRMRRLHAGEADLLRRAMATFKLTGGVSHFRDKLIDGMVARGYERDFAEKTFTQIEGFGSYGFPESHAASFALIAYASSWMKCHHPTPSAPPCSTPSRWASTRPRRSSATRASTASKIRPIDVNHSRWDCTLEPRWPL